ncbi:CAP domain-containing protein [bacterium]|nr:CAP domain-containing protein [bacterium]
MKNYFIPTKQNKYKPLLLRKTCLVFYSIILVVVNTFGGFIGISEVSASNITPSTIVSLTNQERVASGLNELRTNSQLSSAAMAKAQNMLDEQYWDHFGPNGESPWQFIIASGYSYVYAGENLAKGFRTSEGVMEAWMASPTHKENILSGNYKDIGVAVLDGVLLGKQTTLVVQMFGNMTTEVQGNPPAGSNSVTKTAVIDTGQIKAISITHPKAGNVLKDPVMLVKGAVEGEGGGEYLVEITSDGEVLTEVGAKGSNWEYSSTKEWAQGEHIIHAQVMGTMAKSEEIAFEIDSVAPRILRETLQVQKEDWKYILTFDTDQEWHEVKIMNGDEEILFTKSQSEILELEDFSPEQSIVLYVSDEIGNVSELDISEYFIAGVSDEYSNISLSLLMNSLGTSRGVNIVVVGFLLTLIAVEVYVLWRKGKLGKHVGDLFVIAMWVTILSIGIFKGFGGITI